MTVSTAKPTMASRWRRKRRVASRHSDGRAADAVTSGAAGAAATLIGLAGDPEMAPRPPARGRAAAQPWRASGVTRNISSVGDPRIEPAVEQVGDEIEEHHQ